MKVFKLVYSHLKCLKLQAQPWANIMSTVLQSNKSFSPSLRLLGKLHTVVTGMLREAASTKLR